MFVFYFFILLFARVFRCQTGHRGKLDEDIVVEFYTVLFKNLIAKFHNPDLFHSETFSSVAMGIFSHLWPPLYPLINKSPSRLC